MTSDWMNEYLTEEEVRVFAKLRTRMIKCEWCGHSELLLDVVHVEEIDTVMCPECYHQYRVENAE